MKIGYFVERFPEVSETFITGQIDAMRRRGHEIEIDAIAPGRNPPQLDGAYQEILDHTRYGSPAPSGRWARIANAAALLAIWLPRSPGTTLDCLNPIRYGREALNFSILQQRLSRRLETRTFDVIHCHFGPNALRALALREVGALKGPMLTTFHGYDANLLPRLYGARMYAKLFRSCERFTVGSRFMRERLVALGAPADKIEILPMGVDLSRFTASRGAPTDGVFRILTVARLSEVKGIEYALEAVRVLRDRKAAIRYRIVGDGPLRKSLEQRARDIGVADIVEFSGAMSHAEVIALYADADVFLLPGVVTSSGEEEGQGVVLAEAQAACLPVVATNVGGMPECLPEVASQCIVPQRSAEAIADCIGKLMADAPLRQRLARDGRAFVKKHFDATKLLDRLEEAYMALASKGPRSHAA